MPLSNYMRDGWILLDVFTSTLNRDIVLSQCTMAVCHCWMLTMTDNSMWISELTFEILSDSCKCEHCTKVQGWQACKAMRDSLSVTMARSCDLVDHEIDMQSRTRMELEVGWMWRGRRWWSSQLLCPNNKCTSWIIWWVIEHVTRKLLRFLHGCLACGPSQRKLMHSFLPSKGVKLDRHGEKVGLNDGDGEVPRPVSWPLKFFFPQWKDSKSDKFFRMNAWVGIATFCLPCFFFGFGQSLLMCLYLRELSKRS